MTGDHPARMRRHGHGTGQVGPAQRGIAKGRFVQPRIPQADVGQCRAVEHDLLREVRSVLGALRPEDESPPRAPAPSLSGTQEPVRVAGLRALVDDVTAAGLQVTQDDIEVVGEAADGAEAARLAAATVPDVVAAGTRCCPRA